MRIAVLGLGAMGSRVAARLLDRDHEVVVWNRTPAKAVPLIERGATGADSPSDAAARSDAVITMVTDPAALQSVLSGVPSDTTVIQMSTVGPRAVEELDFPRLLDAPVLGSIGEVEAGTLRIFVGGAPELVERWTSLLSELGTPIRVGDIGAGSAAKLVANATLLGSTALLGESLALGESLGLGDRIWDVLAVTPLAQVAERRRPAFESGEYEPRFALSLARKDADLVLEAAGGIDLRVIEAVRRWLADAEAAGLGAADHAAVLSQVLARKEPPVP
jgi:3-hydroxyisobutyrate dehydrogenase-like beta-hydroxyacid dehydrogenase